jgi:protein transport protein SEC31
MDWCIHDPEMLLTTGEDSRTLLWNPSNGRVLSEVQSYGNSFDVQWNPHLASIFATCSFDTEGHVNISSLHSAGPEHVPRWLARPAGASFGFGGKLVAYGLEKSSSDPKKAPDAKPSTKLHLSQISSDPTLLQLAQQFQTVIAQGDWTGFCANKVSF